jgi:hypothetical protein
MKISVTVWQNNLQSLFTEKAASVPPWKKKEKKVLMVIGSLCPISVEGVIRGLRWGIGPKGSEALSSHHIWTLIPSIGQH